MEYTILILLLPVLSFLVSGIGRYEDVPPRSRSDWFVVIGSGSRVELCHGIRLFHLAALGRRDVRNPDTL